MLQSLAVLLIGFSVVSLAILLMAYLFFLKGVQTSRLGAAACVVLCAALAGLQLAHLQYLSTGAELLPGTHYALLLFLAPPAFHLFSRDVLLPDVRPSLRDLLHLAPPLLGPLLPDDLLAPAAFSIGAGYSLRLAQVVHGMRRHVKRFRAEMFFFSTFAALALAVLGLVIAMPWTGTGVFYLAYALAIGIGVVLVTAALLAFPEMLSEISEVAKLSYANSTLKGVDIDVALGKLEDLMGRDRLYRNENLSLGLLAEGVGLTPHQLSELINTRFSMGFPRYVREQRVVEAKRILAEDRRSSVLSIGMMCGFGSQSAFYAAFREVTGISPAAFRKQQSGAEAPE